MGEHDPLPDDLTRTERRLAEWQPGVSGLDEDSLLFDAGRASARRGRWRFVWPAIAAVLAVAAGSLGVWVHAERGERIALAERLRRMETTPRPVAPYVSPSPETPPRDGYLTLRRQALEGDSDAWMSPDLGPDGPSPELPPSPVLQVWRRDALLQE